MVAVSLKKKNEALETVVNNLKELAFSAVKIFDVNNDPKAFSKRLDTTIDFLPASNVWFFKVQYKNLKGHAT